MYFLRNKIENFLNFSRIEFYQHIQNMVRKFYAGESEKYDFSIQKYIE